MSYFPNFSLEERKQMIHDWMERNRVATGFLAGSLYVMLIIVFATMTNREDTDRAELEQLRADYERELARKACASESAE